MQSFPLAIAALACWDTAFDDENTEIRTKLLDFLRILHKMLQIFFARAFGARDHLLPVSFIDGRHAQNHLIRESVRLAHL